MTTSRDKLLSILGVSLFVAALLVLGVVIDQANRSRGKPDAAANSAGAEGDDNPVAAGKMAADFSLTKMGGGTVSLKSLRGKVVLLNVWASWCEPCRDEMPSIEALYEQFKNNRDFVIIAVSEDREGEDTVKEYVESSGFQFPVLFDPQNQVGDAYDVSGIPETFIIDRAGRIVEHHIGPYDWSSPDMHDALMELINSKAG